MKNTIEEHVFDDMAVPRKIKELERFFRELKAQQSPSIKLSDQGSVAFGVDAYNRTTNKDNDSSTRVIMTLTPPNNERLFALPEVEMYGNTFGAAAINVDAEFPTGSAWGAGGNSPNFFDLDVWYDLWDNAFQGKQVATAFVRSRGPAGINILFLTRWRYIQAGSA